MSLECLVYHIRDWILAHQPMDSFFGRLLDISCGCRPSKNLLAPYVAGFVDVDHLGTWYDKSNIDGYGTAYDLPADDGEFDLALCSAVLESLRNLKRR